MHAAVWEGGVVDLVRLSYTVDLQAGMLIEARLSCAVLAADQLVRYSAAFPPTASWRGIVAFFTAPATVEFLATVGACGGIAAVGVAEEVTAAVFVCRVHTFAPGAPDDDLLTSGDVVVRRCSTSTAIASVEEGSKGGFLGPEAFIERLLRRR
jgi:hypothetical protein